MDICRCNGFRPLAKALLLCLIGWHCLVLPTHCSAQENDGNRIDFARDIQPLLSEFCFACHGPDANKRQAGLRLDLRGQAIVQLDSGARAVVPGQPKTSEMVRRIWVTDDERMPPAEGGKRLSETQKRTLERWIAQGANYAVHWSFAPPQKTPLPAIGQTDWPRNQADRFILARLESAGLSPSAETDLAALLRRATLDLTGLPPTLHEAAEFLADRSPDAFERAIDRLLASVHYGEHRVREWLDAARYADTHGYFTDHERFMWRWRDWVIDAYNQNLPFDQFTIEQLAGDLLPAPTQSQRIATGFNRNHMVTEETGVIPEEYRVEYVADRLRTTAAVWMGLTAGCAQCHDHKYDPLTQREFYQLFAFFNQVPEAGISGGKKNAPPLLDLATTDEAAERIALRKKIAALDAKLKVKRPGDDDETDTNLQMLADDDPQRKLLELEREKLRAAEQRLLSLTTTMVMQEAEKSRETFVLIRGQYDQLGERVAAGVPSFLPPLSAGAPSNRLGLAKWLVDPRHPLTSRVAVNRHWRMVFGEGLVASVEDFGIRGELPSHPELLDWLAADFIASGWDVKRLDRRLMESATYRQSSSVMPQQLAADPANRLLGRAARRRLDAEAIRDAALVASGLLDRRVGGPSVKPYQPADLWKHITYDVKNTQTYDQSTGAGLYRRGLYTYWKRQIPPPTLQLLDAPTRETCVLRRQRTNTPLQALALLNDTQFVEAARGLAARVIQSSDDDRQRVRIGFQLVLSRPPTERETTEILRLVTMERAEYRAAPNSAASLLQVGDWRVPPEIDAEELAAWTVVGNLLFNLDESLHRE